MEDQGVVVAIRLSDVREYEQPDPLCLRAEDLSKWLHLEVLLRNMYKDPPPSIRVTYLDNEDDWVQISCDEELADAVRMTQQSDNILLFQVKRLDPPVYFESTLATTPTAPKIPTPTLPEEEEYLKNIASQPCQPLAQSNTSVPYVTSDKLHHEASIPLIQLLAASNIAKENSPQTGPNEDVLILGANGKTASLENRPDLSTEEKIAHLKSMMSLEHNKEDQRSQGLNSLASGSVWEQASSLPSTEKLKFLKGMISGAGKQLPDVKSSEGSALKRDEQATAQKLLLEPLCSENGSLGQNMLFNQDPFETPARPSDDLEQVHLPQPTLTPVKTNQGATALTMQNVSLEIEPDQPQKSDEAFKPLAPMVIRSSSQQPSGAVENVRLGKGPVTPPVPLPRTLQMMEGAQSGANAVAIEIPEACHGAAQKEEDVTASGGTSCTSASAETGEMSTDGSYHAAAVGREMKGMNDPYAVSAISSDVRPLERLHPAHSKKQSAGTEDKKKSENGSKKKESSGKEQSTKKRSSTSEKRKKETSPAKKEDKKIKADVQTKEKSVGTSKSETSTQYKDLVKHIKKMKKELHSSIVKDVAKETDKLIKKNMRVRSVSCDSYGPDVYHCGVFCDSCNDIINGIRYKCGNCYDFDLCEKCEALPNVHDSTHVFLKLRRPARFAGLVNNTDYLPLLRENVYKLESCGDGDVYKGYLEVISECCDGLSDDEDPEDLLSTTEPAGHSPVLVPDHSDKELTELCDTLKPLTFSKETAGPEEEYPPVTDVKDTFDSTDVLIPSTLTEVAESVNSVKTEEIILAEKRDETVPVPCEERQVINPGDYETIPANEVTDEENISNVDSDTSDDFCVIDPPSREEFEACGMEFSSQNPFVAFTSYSKTESLTDSDAAPFCTIVKRDNSVSSAEDKAIQESMEKTQTDQSIPATENIKYQTEEDSEVSMLRKESPEQVARAREAAESVEKIDFHDKSERANIVEQKSEEGDEKDDSIVESKVESVEHIAESKVESVEHVAVSDPLTKMSPEERKRFQEMVDTLHEKARDLEHHMNMKKEFEAKYAIECQREKEVQLILEAKRNEAAMENDKLERMNMNEVAVKLEKWQAMQERRRQTKIKRLKQSKEKQSPKGAEDNKQDAEKETEVQTDSVASASENAALSPSVDVQSSVDMPQTKDADCQTNPNLDPAHMFHQVAHNMSKAAASAFSTARDVVYALQAKHSDKKAANSNSKPAEAAALTTEDTWTPPTSVWTPPKNDYVPPRSDWVPPKQEWTPPKNEWTPPNSDWKPPTDTYKPPSSDYQPPGCDYQPPKEDSPQLPTNSRYQKKETNRHSQESPMSPTPPISAIPVVDSELRQEVVAMQRLMEMGFANRDQNRKLLQQFHGDLEKVVQSLLQEEGGDHWATHRH